MRQDEKQTIHTPEWSSHPAGKSSIHLDQKRGGGPYPTILDLRQSDVQQAAGRLAVLLGKCHYPSADLSLTLVLLRLAGVQIPQNIQARNNAPPEPISPGW
ncbi:hypothetical protein D3C76_1373360 [compost metagenome]